MGPHDSAMYSTTWQILQHYRDSVIFEDDEDFINSEPKPPVPPLPSHRGYGKGESVGSTKNFGDQRWRGIYSVTPETLSPVTPPRSASPEFDYASSHSSKSSYSGESRPKQIRERRSPKGSHSEHWPLDLKLTKTNGSTDLEHKNLPKWKVPQEQRRDSRSGTEVPPIPPKNARRSIEGLPSNPRPDRNIIQPGRQTGLRRSSKESDVVSSAGGRNGPPLRIAIPSSITEPPVRMDGGDAGSLRQTGKRRPSQSRPSAGEQYQSQFESTHNRQPGSYDSMYTDISIGYKRNDSIDSFGDRISPKDNKLSNLVVSGLRSASEYGDSPKDSPSSAYTTQQSIKGTWLGVAKRADDDSSGPLTHHNLATPFSQPEIMYMHNPSYDGSVLSPPSAGPRQSFGFGAPIEFPQYDFADSLRGKSQPRRESDMESPLGGKASASIDDDSGILSPKPLRISHKAPPLVTDDAEKMKMNSTSRYNIDTSYRSNARQGTDSPPPPPPPPKPVGLPMGPRAKRDAEPGPPPLPRKDTPKAGALSNGQRPAHPNSKVESVRSKLDKSKTHDRSPTRMQQPARGLADMFDMANSPSPGSEAPARMPETVRQSATPDSAQRFFRKPSFGGDDSFPTKPLPSADAYGKLNPFDDSRSQRRDLPSAKSFESMNLLQAPYSGRATRKNRYDLSPASSYNLDEGGPGPTAPSSAVSPAFRSANNLAPPQSSAFLSPASAAFGPPERLRTSGSPPSPSPAPAVTQKHFDCSQAHKRQVPQSNDANPVRCMACWANPTRIWRCGDCELLVCSSCRSKLGNTRGDLTAVLDLTEADRKPNMSSTRQIVDAEDARRMPGLSPLSANIRPRPRAYTSESVYPNESSEGRYATGRRSPGSSMMGSSPYHSLSNSTRSGFSNHERTYSNLSSISSNSSLPVGASAFGRYSSVSGNAVPPSHQGPPSAGFSRPRQSPGIPMLSDMGGGPYPGSRSFPPRAPSSGMAQPTSYPGRMPPPAMASAQPSPRSMPASSPGLRIRSTGGRSPGMGMPNLGGGLATPRSHQRAASTNLRDGPYDPSAAALSVGGGPYPGATQTKSVPRGGPANAPPPPLQMPMPPPAPRGLPMGGPRPGGPRAAAGRGMGGPPPAGGPPGMTSGGQGVPPPTKSLNGRPLPPGAGFGLPGVPKNIRAGVPGRPGGTMRVGM